MRLDHQRRGIGCRRARADRARSRVRRGFTRHRSSSRIPSSCKRCQKRGTSGIMKGMYTWSAILAIVFASVVGDVLLARAMKQVGDVGALRRRAGLGVVIGRTLGNGHFLLGVIAMAVAFFSLLFALSWGDVSLVAPAAASLTFIGNA